MPLIVAGTGTDVGKTLFAAALLARYGQEKNLFYCKPVQTGPASDSAMVAKLSGIHPQRILPEFIRLPLAASPHFAAEQNNTPIAYDALLDYTCQICQKHNTVVELAGGLLVPLVRYRSNLDLVRDLRLPVVLVARTELGTINHSMLSLLALRQRGIFCAGIFFVGQSNPLYPDNRRSIVEMSGVPFLGELFLPNCEITSAAEFAGLLANFDPEQKLYALL
ncbi:MAG: dethiobiotin synthase [Leptospiraceae bacterium]|nr:dethiobiotin synthase [Leptospiraceae bacterium]